jgi:glucosyl-dolichyl phosphate glucuronosyltransferase
MKFSVIIPTYNRSGELKKTLQDLSKVSSIEASEVIVVDNNSNDDTPEVVARLAETFPGELRYLFEKEQGRPAAMNTGVASARGEILVFTDDDHRFEPDWLEAAAGGLDRLGCDYVGGKILPLWSGPQPAWLSTDSGRHRAVIGMADYGPEPFEFGKSPAMGGNMAVRREAFARAGLWDNRLGRRGKTLLGQEIREWCMRARAANLRGFYVPEMVVYHIVPVERLSRKYFRRWFYWHGISRAVLYENFGLDMESPEETVLDFATVPHIGGVPRYMYRTFLSSCARTAKAYMRGDVAEAFDHEMWLWFFAGVVRQRRKDRGARHSAETHAPAGAEARGEEAVR